MVFNFKLWDPVRASVPQYWCQTPVRLAPRRLSPHRHLFWNRLIHMGLVDETPTDLRLTEEGERRFVQEARKLRLPVNQGAESQASSPSASE
jgi:hypothetical protein